MRSFLKELAVSLSFREAKGELGAAGESLSAQRVSLSMFALS